MLGAWIWNSEISDREEKSADVHVLPPRRKSIFNNLQTVHKMEAKVAGTRIQGRQRTACNEHSSKQPHLAWASFWPDVLRWLGRNL